MLLLGTSRCNITCYVAFFTRPFTLLALSHGRRYVCKGSGMCFLIIFNVFDSALVAWFVMEN